MKFVNNGISIAIILGIVFSIDGGENQDSTTKNPLIREAAEKHNNSTLLCILPPELFDYTFDFFVDPSEPIEQSIKNSLALSATCTYFNSSLSYFGELYQKYPVESKDSAMRALQGALYKYNSEKTYWKNRRAFLLLIYAKTNHNVSLDYERKCSNALFRLAVEFDDIQMVNALLCNGVDPNTIPPHNMPIFFKARSKEMAEVFTKHGSDWTMVPRDFFTSATKSSILHYRLALGIFPGTDKVLAYLLTIIPKNMINLNLPTWGTPLDCANQTIVGKDSGLSAQYLENYERERLRICELLKDYGAKTTKELEEIDRKNKEICNENHV